MNHLEKAYRIFGDLVLQPSLLCNYGLTCETVSFPDLCKKLRVVPSDLDEIIYRETGFTGEEILEALK